MKQRYASLTHKLQRGALGWHIRVLRWTNAHISQNLLVIIIALIIGIVAGAMADVLKRLIKFFNELALDGVHIDEPNIRLLIWPLAGILITSIFQRYVVRKNISHGTKIIREDLARHNYRMSPYTIFNPVFGCSLTIGSGASGGSEGPSALSGAAFGSVVARWFRLSEPWQRILLGIGGGAGIAAIFKSPMGGALFTLEILQMQISTVAVLALITSCLFASATAYLLSGFTFDIHFAQYMPPNPSTLGWVALLGIFCGIYSVYYNISKQRAGKLFLAIKNPWLAAIATGGVLSIGVFMFPVLFGEGFNLITHVVNGEQHSYTAMGLFAGQSGIKWFFIGMCAVLLLKGVLVSASFCGGGIAGDFVPTIFAGCVAGHLFSATLNIWLGLQLPTWYFALIGMGAVMGGTLHAPLMAIFIICETTNTYAYLLPYIIAVLLSYFTVKLLTPKALKDTTAHDDLKSLWQLKDVPDLRAEVKQKRSSHKLDR